MEFTEAELSYLRQQGRGRLASIGLDGVAQIHPVRFVVTDARCLEFGQRRLSDSVKYRNIRRDPRVSITVEDYAVTIPGLVEFGSRGVEIRGIAELTPLSADIVSVRPLVVTSWNIDSPGRHSRFLR